MLGQHKYRYFYFLGRTLSFTLAGMIAGGLGAVLNVLLHQFHIPAVASFLFGGIIILVGFSNLLGWKTLNLSWRGGFLSKINRSLSLFLLRDQPFAVFLFGLFTILLPCGQTVIVYSACALSGDMYVGMVNGFAFALLTSPALFLAMHAQTIFQKVKHHYDTIIGLCAIVVGVLAICRGFAELGVISHLVLNPSSPGEYHIALF